MIIMRKKGTAVDYEVMHLYVFVDIDMKEAAAAADEEKKIDDERE